MNPTEALDALFAENELPMSDRNGVLYDALRDALAEAEKAETVHGTYLDQITEAKRDFAEWPQWMKDSAHISAAVAHPPAALPELAALTALQRLADTADAVGVRHFDSDDLSPEVENMQEATQHARAVIAAARGKG